jgi:hypothetical protein
MYTSARRRADADVTPWVDRVVWSATSRSPRSKANQNLDGPLPQSGRLLSDVRPDDLDAVGARPGHRADVGTAKRRT